MITYIEKKLTFRKEVMLSGEAGVYSSRRFSCLN